MSSTVSTTQLHTITKKVVLTHPKMEDKRLVRTSSLEKIKRFNSFICSQQYYVLPALLAWLRSSHSALISSTEKTIFFFRSLIFSHLLSLVSNSVILVRKQGVYVRSREFLKLAAYSTGVILILELGVCFYLLWRTCVPLGLGFLVGCMVCIIFLNCKCLELMKCVRRGARRKVD